MLQKAIELGDILAKAFNTPTGIPYGTVNLANGGSVPPGETQITSLATAGTFIIEFGVLSKLTGNPLYENLAKDSLLAIWNFRSEKRLLGNHIDITNGRWTSAESSIGGNSDSFYEYLLKGSILFGDTQLRDIFDQSYDAIMNYLYYKPWYLKVNMKKVSIASATFESLQAFWPGLQVMLGDIERASDTMHAFQSLWHQFGFVPELYDLHKDRLVNQREQYPLRPEMAESLYYLYSATKDPIWLQYGKEIVNSIEKYATVPCGIAAIENVRTKEKRDLMDSFFLSETCKYLYLLFTPEHPIAKSQKYVFNTEGHPFPMRYEWLQDKTGKLNVGQCVAPSLATQLSHGNFQPIRHHAARLDDIKKIDALQEAHHSIGANDMGDTTKTTTHEEEKVVELPATPQLTVELLSDAHGIVLVQIVEPELKEDTEAGEQIVFLANFGTQELPEDGIRACAVRTLPTNACDELNISNNSLDGKIAIVNRGACDFVVKVRNCQAEGAQAVIVVNNIEMEDGQNISMYGEAEDIEIPSALVSNSFGKLLDSLLASRDVEIFFTQDGLNKNLLDSNTIVLDLAKLNSEDPESSLEYFDSIFKALGVEHGEDYAQINRNDIVMGWDLTGHKPGTLIGKKMHDCVDGEC